MVGLAARCEIAQASSFPSSAKFEPDPIRPNLTLLIWKLQITQCSIILLFNSLAGLTANPVGFVARATRSLSFATNKLVDVWGSDSSDSIRRSTWLAANPQL